MRGKATPALAVITASQAGIRASLRDTTSTTATSPNTTGRLVDIERSVPHGRAVHRADDSGADVEHGLAEDGHLRPYAEAGGCRRRHVPLAPLRRAVGDAHRDVRVEVGGGEQEPRRRAVRQVRDGGRDDVAAPRVLD